MSTSIRTQFAGLLVLTTLIASLVYTTPALADGGGTAGGAASGGSSSRGAPDGGTASSTQQLPSGTKIVVVDAQGNKLPLGSQAAHDISSAGDPIWCPASVMLPIASGSGCTASFASMALLLSSLTTTPPTVDGTIWIEKGSALITTTGISLDGTSLTGWATHKLTLKGGWDGIGFGTTDPADPSEFTNQPISILNWKNSVTVSDIEIHNVTGTGLTVTMQASNAGSITLTRVNSHNNTVYGANLDNSSLGDTGTLTISSSSFDNNSGARGLQANSHGKITVSNVSASGNTLGMGAMFDNHAATSPQTVTLSGDNTFDNNDYNGVEIWAIGAVTANDITATGNGLSTSSAGIQIDNCQLSGTCTGSGAVTLTGTTIATGNYAGMFVTSNGAIKANNLIVNSNQTSYGADLDNSSATLAQPVTLTGSSQFKGNAGNGLEIFSRGLVTTNNLTASYNTGGVGVDISNTTGSLGVTLNGTNIFIGNHFSGLSLGSNGLILVNSVTANCNGYSDNCVTPSGGSGIVLDNSLGTNKSVTLTGTNILDQNDLTNLIINSKGAIILNNVTANGSTHDYGASLDNCQYNGSICTGAGAVTLNGTNSFSGNYYDGLDINSNGAIKVNSVTAAGNGLTTFGYGVYLDNHYSTLVQPVSLTGTNNTSGNYAAGTDLVSRGAITINSLVSDNSAASEGLYLNLSGAQSVTLTGTSEFNGNHADGLDIYTLGQISLNNVSAKGNGSGGVGTGAYLQNAGGAGKDVVLTGTNEFSYNHTDGLDISTFGNIKLNNMTGNCNGYSTFCTGALSYGSAISADNCQFSAGSCQGHGTITLSGNNIFTGNFGTGIYLTSGHAVSMNNVTASGNGMGSPYGYGAQVSNDNASTPQSVTLTGTNTFNGNYTGGLSINASGSIIASNLNASNNTHGDGVDIYNNYGSASSTAAVITLTGTSVISNNYGYGLAAGSYGAISVSTLTFTASGDGVGGTVGYGLSLDNSGSTAATAPSITMKGSGTFNGDYWGGLYLQSKGAISANSVTADSTIAGYGAQFANGGSTTAKGITLTGTNNFSHNYSNGLDVGSKGIITLNSVTADCNGFTSGCSGAGAGGTGIHVDNSSASSAQAVNLTGTNHFDNNNGTGLDITSLGTINVGSFTADSNVAYGAQIDNSSGTGDINLTGTSDGSLNGVVGVVLHTIGSVSASGLTADRNTGTGLWVQGPAVNVKLTCGSFTNNGGNGVNVSASGTLTWIGGSASGNTAGDVNPSLSSWNVVVRNCP
jgi:hypothetical protein